MKGRPQPPPTYFARIRFRNWNTVFGIGKLDRFFHMYLVGKTGTGKSTALDTMMRQDLVRGEGFCLIDPHGDLVERVAAAVPNSRQSDVLFLDAPNPLQPFGLNPLRHVARERRPLAAGGLLEVFKKSWDARSWGTRLEHILRNAILALLDYPEATLADVLRLLNDRRFRATVLEHVENPVVRDFWLEDYEKWPPRLRLEAIAPVQTKVGAFLADPRLARILTAPDQVLHIRRMMDEGKVLLVNLSRGELGEDSASPLGGLLVTTIALAAFSRADLPEDARRPFFLYIDEFQNFATRALPNMASELRKYGVGLVLAHQYLAQLEPEVRHGVLGNVGTVVVFRVGPEDAGVFAREFEPKFAPIDLMSLANHHICLRLMIDGAPSTPFSGTTIQRFEIPIGLAADIHPNLHGM